MIRVIALCGLLNLSSVALISAQDLLDPWALHLLDSLDSLELNAGQIAKINQLAADFEPPISQAESIAKETAAQRQERDDAIRRAVEAGKKGIEARMIIGQAGASTAEQRAARRKIDQLQSDFKRKVVALLTDSQKARLNLAIGPERLGNDELEQSDFNGYIIIRFSPTLPDATDASKTLGDFVKELKLEALATLLDATQLSTSRRVVPGISRDSILDAKQSPEQQRLLRRLRSYWRIDFRADIERIEETLARLNQLTAVDLAYPELMVSQPAVCATVNATDDPHNSLQGYQDAKPIGIDARYAWTRPNCKGQGIGFADLEQGWNICHEDFVGKAPAIMFGNNRFSSIPHGTAVLGQVAADDNASGVVGIAPCIDFVFLASHYRAADRTNFHVADAIYTVLPLLSPGDVLLLEVCRGKKPIYPTEVNDADFDAIQLGALQGIIIVEAAGNGGKNLDEFKLGGKRILNRTDMHFRDSGAIVVGAADSQSTHERTAWSSHGTRVDCFGWGRNVATTGHNGKIGGIETSSGDINKQYSDSFDGTSAAAPIIAGAAVLLQSMSKANAGAVISPANLRAMLSNPATGTTQGPTVPGNIGVMPDLKAIIEINEEFM